MAEKLNLDNYNPPLSEWKFETLINGQLAGFLEQQQPGRDARVAFVIFRFGNELALRVAYSIRQKFRTPADLRDIFAPNSSLPDDLRPRLCALNKDNNCAQFIPLHLIGDWRMSEKGNALIEFSLTRNDLLRAIQYSALYFDANFPVAIADVSPSAKISTRKLDKILPVIFNQK